MNPALVPFFQKRKYIFIFTTMILLFICGLYLKYEWNQYNEIASSEAIKLAKALEAMIRPQDIETLSVGPEDIEAPEYIMAKTSLMRLVEAIDRIHYAYIIIEQNNNFFYLMDSESPESPHYSSPGKAFRNEDYWVWSAINRGETVITPPRSDLWGNWVTVLVPIKDLENEQVIAVFGVDYSASEWYAELWKQMILDIVIAIFVLLLHLSLIHILIQHLLLKSQNKKLAIDEALFRSIFNQAPIGIAVMEGEAHADLPDFGYTTINPTYAKILGREEDDLKNMTWVEITHPDDLAADLEKYDQFKKGEINGYSMEKRYLRPDGSSVWVHMVIAPLDLSDDKRHHICLIQDITERKTIEEALSESERSKSVFLSHLPGLAYRCNNDYCWTMQYVSEGCLNLTGYPPESLLYNRELSYNDLISPEYREELRKEWERILPKKEPFKYEYEIITATGEKKWVLELGQGIYNEQGEVEALEGIVLDISDRKAMENTLKYNNEHDSWTGLYNRNYLESSLEKDIKLRKGLKKALIEVNLNAINLLTLNYGFQYSLNLIKKVAEALSQHCTENRLLFHPRENSFIFYILDYKDKNELLEFSNVIIATLKSLFITERVRSGIGILEIEQNQEQIDVDLLLRRLLIASEKSVNSVGKDFEICFYDEELEALVNRERDIIEALNLIAAAEYSSNDLFLQYQPIINLKTGSICGFEALARLRTEKLGLVPPLEFISIAEKTKLIIPIGEEIIVKALLFLNRLRDCGFDEINVSINVSVIQLLNPDFTTSFFELINKMQVNPKNISIEITESIFAYDFEYINNVIEKLREAGIQIAIDDFGIGYSSLAREKELKVECVKIDKRFIDNLLEPDLSKVITSDVISISHKLGHYTVAEGVEHEIQLQYLKEYSCDRIQGYLISEPLDEEEALEFLKKHEQINCPKKSAN